MNKGLGPTLLDIEECVKSNRLWHKSDYHSMSNEERHEFPLQLLEWYHREKRTTMPWRKDSLDRERRALGQRAYEVWVSEIMLQQTQVATVIDYYHRWINKFPTIDDLAKADIEQVNTLWAGLGYYSRARRLWEGARKIVSEFDGLLPDNAKDLQAHIPGVGRYTAGAIASIVYHEQVPVVDGNVIRVLARTRAIHGDPKKAKTVDLFWEIAASLVPCSAPGDFNQAIMELGAQICTPQNPKCDECPVQTHCIAYKQLGVFKTLSKKKRKRSTSHHGCSTCHELQSDLVQAEETYRVTRYPLKVEKKPPRDEECAVSIVECIKDNESYYLLSKRPETGLLAGLWEFPSLELESPINKVDQSTEYLRTRYQIELKDAITRVDLGNVIHLFSHIRKVYHIEWIQYKNDLIVQNKSIKWVTLAELKTSPIPTGLKKALKVLEKFKVNSIKKKPKTIASYFKTE
ncbi:DNA glycosylase [Pilobolus umbonatus]|nr:DNA glycosylase [Pilobolus umbonatus]